MSSMSAISHLSTLLTHPVSAISTVSRRAAEISDTTVAAVAETLDGAYDTSPALASLPDIRPSQDPHAYATLLHNFPSWADGLVKRMGRALGRRMALEYADAETVDAALGSTTEVINPASDGGAYGALLHNFPPHSDGLVKRDDATGLGAGNDDYDGGYEANHDVLTILLVVAFGLAALMCLFYSVKRYRMYKANVAGLPRYQDAVHGHQGMAQQGSPMGMQQGYYVDEYRNQGAGGLRNIAGLTIAPPPPYPTHTGAHSALPSQEKFRLASECSSPVSPPPLISPPLPSPVPEIRITFPDEMDRETGRRLEGKVCVVRVGEGGIGLEPLPESQQPPRYAREGFESIELERKGREVV
jgi:hypothetical protein